MSHEIRSEAQLRALMGSPVHELVVAKSSPVITAPLRRFIECSPFACLATHAADGSSDVSPRGDPPGFVHVLDEKTLVMPERPGNKRFDSLVNIINQPKLALLFMIPGVLETVRVNGTGVITTDPELLARFPIGGKLPQLAIVITVEEAMGHCSKAYRRSKLWQSDYIPGAAVPTLTQMMASHLSLDTATSQMLDRGIEEDVRHNMY